MKPGAAFGDYITTGKRERVRRYDDVPNIEHRLRVFLFPLLIFFVFGILTVRLISLQIFQGWYYRLLSDSNRTRTTTIHAPRGIIFDRNGIPLVYNVPGFRLRKADKTLFIGRDKAVALLTHGEKNLEIDALREYPLKEAASHVIGYVGQISQDELTDPAYQAYQGGAIIGKSGLEKMYESMLRGIDGKELVEVDSMGNIVRTLGQTDPIPGQDMTVTLDSTLQQEAFMAMKNVKKGALIMSTPQGEILAMVSKPSFDPNLFTFDETYKVATDASYRDVSSIVSDSENQPFLNRAIAGVYPPGSTFKLITATAGLETHIIDASYEVTDTGILRVGDFSFANWYYSQYGRTEGDVNIVTAIKRSNDIFFYKLAEKVGVEDIAKTARLFGLGKPLGIDLPGEQTGIVPDPSWKEAVVKEPWYLGDTYHYGIGQGYLLVTPLQVNAWTQVIANGGTLYEPHLLKMPNPKIERSNLLSESTKQLIQEGMIESCSTGGVAWPLFNFTIRNAKLPIDQKNFESVPEATTSAAMKEYRKVILACKTGTSQHGGDQTLPHAWITLFAPAYNPQIVVTVLAEDSGEGSNIAAPIAKQILGAWFSR